MENLEQLLKEHGQRETTFSADFTDRVMDRLEREPNTRIVRLWQKTFWYSAAASIALFVLGSLAVDGDLSFDTVMGMSNYSDYEIGQMMQDDASLETFMDAYFQ